MKRNSRLAVALSALLAAGPFPALAQEETAASQTESEDTAREARLTVVEGTVYLHLHDAAETEFIPAEADAAVEDGDMIRVGQDGRAELTIDGESVIEVAANSDFVVNSLEREHTEFHIGVGSILAKIKHLLSSENMEFHTETAVAAVRGTELGVSQEDDGAPSRIGVFDEGKVAVSRGGKDAGELGPGQELEVRKTGDVGRPAALKHFAPARERFGALRGRQDFWAKKWVRRDRKARMAQRGRMRRMKAFRAGQLKGVKATHQARRYEALKARRELLRAQRRQRMKNRQQNRPAQGPKKQQGQKKPADPQAVERQKEERQRRRQEEQERRKKLEEERARRREEMKARRQQEMQERRQKQEEMRQRRQQQMQQQMQQRRQKNQRNQQ